MLCWPVRIGSNQLSVGFYKLYLMHLNPLMFYAFFLPLLDFSYFNLLWGPLFGLMTNGRSERAIGLFRSTQPWLLVKRPAFYGPCAS
jgi:hypothetical protein